MIFNFDEAIDRHDSNSYKWDSRNDIPDDTIPLWVADMDFKVAPPIIKALRNKVEHGVFGYTFVPPAYYKAIDLWFTRNHGWSINADDVIYTTGVVPALSAIIKALTSPGDKVLVNTPVYNCFFSSIRNNGCEVLESELKISGDTYVIDYADLEEKASDDRCTMMILCNPHNPAGRVWSRGELLKISEICARHSVLVVSDEIHCELVFQPAVYTPYANVSTVDDWVVCVSPSKAFNIAGLQIANIVTSNKDLYQKINKAINVNEVCDVNPFGVAALMAAYNESRDWLEALLPYIYDNYKLLRNRFTQDLPQLKVFELEGTYLAWIDCRVLGIESERLEELLIEKAHVWLNAGSMYGDAGEGFMRVNLACPRKRLEEAIDRLIPVLQTMLDR